MLNYARDRKLEMMQLEFWIIYCRHLLIKMFRLVEIPVYTNFHAAASYCKTNNAFMVRIPAPCKLINFYYLFVSIAKIRGSIERPSSTDGVLRGE